MDYDCGGSRNKKKDKKREKKRNPYKSGGSLRSSKVDLKESQKASKKKK